jgi:hypothetical protein
MWYAPGMALADHKIDQFSLQTEAGHKSRGGPASWAPMKITDSTME